MQYCVGIVEKISNSGVPNLHKPPFPLLQMKFGTYTHNPQPILKTTVEPCDMYPWYVHENGVKITNQNIF